MTMLQTKPVIRRRKLPRRNQAKVIPLAIRPSLFDLAVDLQNPPEKLVTYGRGTVACTPHFVDSQKLGGWHPTRPVNHGAILEELNNVCRCVIVLTLNRAIVRICWRLGFLGIEEVMPAIRAMKSIHKCQIIRTYLSLSNTIDGSFNSGTRNHTSECLIPLMSSKSPYRVPKGARRVPEGARRVPKKNGDGHPENPLKTNDARVGCPKVPIFCGFHLNAHAYAQGGLMVSMGTLGHPSGTSKLSE